MKAENHSHKDTAVSFMRLVGSGKVREAYDRIAKLWDFGQAVPQDSPNGHGMF